MSVKQAMPLPAVRALRELGRDLALAPRVLQDRTAAMSDALMMRARDLARDSALTEAMVRELGAIFARAITRSLQDVFVDFDSRLHR